MISSPYPTERAAMGGLLVVQLSFFIRTRWTSKDPRARNETPPAAAVSQEPAKTAFVARTRARQPATPTAESTRRWPADGSTAGGGPASSRMPFQSPGGRHLA